MSRIHWLAGMAALVLIAAPAMSQEFEQPGDTPFLIGQPLLSSQYWLGIECSPVPPALRSHLSLPDKQGVLVAAVVKGSPAAKAGLAQYDVLLRAGDKPLAEPRDLLAAVDAAKETVLKIELIRAGKPQTIPLTPAKRPEQIAGPRGPADQADWDTISKWLEGMKSGDESGLPSFNFTRPGMILPKGVVIPRPFLPGNVSVVVTKQGDQPAKIVVKRGDQKWEVTEKELDKLPADVRPHVEQMLGRNVFGTVGGPSASGAIVLGQMPALTVPGQMPPTVGTFNVPAPPPGMMQVQPFPGGLDPRLEKRLDELDRRMDKLLDMMEKMSQNRLGEAAPEHQEEK